MAPGAPAVAAERLLVLELVLNGVATGKIGEFHETDGTLSASAAELAELGFVVPEALARGGGPVPLAALPGVQIALDRAGQRLLVTAAAAALRPTEIGEAGAAPLVPVSPAGTGAVLNYDILGTEAGHASSAGASFDARLFSPYGVLSATALGTAAYTVQPGLRRLDTTYLYSDPDTLQRWRVGDVVSGGLSWTRPVRLGGGQVASDFSLQPNLVTYPLPVVTSSAAVPSTVDVLVNGIRQFSQPVQPGPFQIRSLPVVTGAGEVAVSVQDQLGRQTLVTLPFYVAPEMLTPGLASYSVEAGLVRQSYGLPGDAYAGGAGAASLRYGLTAWLTAEAHTELAANLQMGGPGVAVRLGTLGVLSLAAAASNSRGTGTTATAAPDKPEVGGLGSIGFSRRSGGLSLSLAAATATAGFRDIASLNGSPYPRFLVSATIARSFGAFGSLGLGYVRQQGGQGIGPTIGTAIGTGTGLGANVVLPNGSAGNVGLVTASYSLQLTDTVGFYANAFKDLPTRNLGIAVGLTFFLGHGISGAAGGGMDGGRISSTLQASRPAIEPGDLGFSVADQEGFGTSRRAEAEYAATWGRATVGAAQAGGATAGQPRPARRAGAHRRDAADGRSGERCLRRGPYRRRAGRAGDVRKSPHRQHQLQRTPAGALPQFLPTQHAGHRPRPDARRCPDRPDQPGGPPGEPRRRNRGFRRPPQPRGAVDAAA